MLFMSATLLSTSMTLPTAVARVVCLVAAVVLGPLATAAGAFWGRSGIGAPVAADGGVAVVGHPHRSDGDFAGRREWRAGSDALAGADLFDVATGDHLVRLTPRDPADYHATPDALTAVQARYGYSVDLHDDRAIVGAVSGAAAFVFDTADGSQVARLTLGPTPDGPFDLSTPGQFGYDVAISSGVAVVGDPRRPNGNGRGAAYVFDSNTGELLHTLTEDDVAGPGRPDFGWSVATDGDWVLVGGVTDARLGLADAGVYVYDARTGQRSDLLVPDVRTEGGSGGVYDIAIDNGVAVVGYINPATPASIFDVATGRELATLRPPDDFFARRFGRWVDIQGSTAIVGSPSTNEVLVYNALTGDLLQTLTAEGVDRSLDFGGGVAIDGETLLVTSRSPLEENFYQPSVVDRYGPTTFRGVQAFALIPEPGGATLLVIAVMSFVTATNRLEPRGIGFFVTPRRCW